MMTTYRNVEVDQSTVSRLMLDRAPMMIAFVGPDERYQSANQQYARFFRKPLEEIVGHPVREVVGASAYGQLQSYIQRALAGEEIEYSEWLDFGAGQRRYWSTAYQPEVLDGEVRGFFVYVLDRTGEKLAAEARQDRERIYRDLFENSAVRMAQLGPDRRWLDVNVQLCSGLGYTRAELLALNLDSVFHPADLAANEQELGALLRGEKDRYQTDMRLIGKDGSVTWGHVTLTAVHDEAGALLYVTLVIKDITARKEAEKALEELNATLESRIGERTAELQGLNQELDAFNYSVSHDLRAPLRGINGFSHLLLEEYADRLDDQGRHYLERIRAGAERLGELLDALLTLSRLTRTELERTTVDLSSIAAAKIAQLREEEPMRKVRVDIQPGILVQGDERLMRIVLRTLLENAWKFTTERDEAEITVRAERQGQDVIVAIADNGAGFDPRHADKLFVPFQTLHSPGRFQGHGIGLATVQRIIQRHGGRVWAEGAVDQGATFYFRLRAA
jgi:PAS domain S-box-containing protein